VKTELELRHLRVFVAVVETGAHTRAAKALGLSQSTVSETLSSLERALGAALFRKTSKGSPLTPSGAALLPYARQMLALSGEIVLNVAKVSNDVSATLAIAAVESLSAYVLPSRLAALRERWPNVRMEVTTAACAEIRESVAAGRCDVGLTIEADAGIDDESILAHSHLIIFGSATRTYTSPDELQRCEFYMSDAAGDYHQVLRQYFETLQLPPPRTQALGSVEGVKRGVMTASAALGLLPAYAIERELREGVLVELPVTPSLRGLVLRVLYGAGAAESPIVNDLVEHLRDATSLK
jgi:DNA-binding transcriptional LysR family regulator